MMIAWKFNALPILDNMISNKERQKVIINLQEGFLANLEDGYTLVDCGRSKR
jgi:hypothetical protein